MSRPSFQFYTKDWRSNSKLRRCSPAARGVWIDILCALHDSDEYGIARYSLKELASEVGANLAHCRELVAKGVLKGADSGAIEEFIYVPRSGRKDGPPVALLSGQVGPIWYSSRMVKDEYVNTHRGENTRFGDGEGDGEGETPKPPPKPAPKPSPTRREGDGPSTASATASRDSPPPPGVAPSPKPKASKRCPGEFLVTADLQRWAREKAPLVDIRAETATFRDYEFPRAKTDWPATWRVWIAKEQKRLAEKRSPNGAVVDVGYGLETLPDRAKRERIAEMTGGLASRQPTNPPGPSLPALPESLDGPARGEH